MTTELLTTDELSARIKYDVRTIRERLMNTVLIEGEHFFRPFGGRKILFIWAAIERDMIKASRVQPVGMNAIPMASGGAVHV